MVQQGLDLDKMTVTELKALKCDLYEVGEQNRINIQIVNDKIQKKQRAEQAPVEPKEETK
jgi:hypothetical protein